MLGIIIIHEVMVFLSFYSTLLFQLDVVQWLTLVNEVKVSSGLRKFFFFCFFWQINMTDSLFLHSFF